MTKVAINGFGRIGRTVLRLLAKRESSLEVVAINDLTSPATLAHLFKYDSVHGSFPGVTLEGDVLNVGRHHAKIFAVKNPAELPWKDLGVDLVLECTGIFRSLEKCQAHLDAGAKKVLISAPGEKGVPTFVMGVNEHLYNPATQHIMSNASCTTNCLAPVVRVLHENYKIVHGLMTTIHSYTNDQNILDLPHKDLRRARAAAMSMIPTSTGAAKAIGLVMPDLNGKIDGYAMRVPTPNVSVVDFVCTVEKVPTAAEVNEKLRLAAKEGPLAGYLFTSDEPLVSIDFNGSTASSTADLGNTVVMGNMIKTLAWYDNESGYSARLLDLADLVASKL